MIPPELNAQSIMRKASGGHRLCQNQNQKQNKPPLKSITSQKVIALRF